MDGEIELEINKSEKPVFNLIQPLADKAAELLRKDQEWLSVKMVDISDSNESLRLSLEEAIKPELIGDFDLTEEGITKMIEQPKWEQDKDGYPQPNKPGEKTIPFNRTVISTSRDRVNSQSMLSEGGAAFCGIVLSFDELGNANIWHEQDLYRSGTGDSWQGNMKNSMEYFLRSGELKGNNRRVLVTGMDSPTENRIGIAKKVDTMIERINTENNRNIPMDAIYLFATPELETKDGYNYQHCIYSCIYIPPALHKENKTEVLLVGNKVKRG